MRKLPASECTAALSSASPGGYTVQVTGQAAQQAGLASAFAAGDGNQAMWQGVKSGHGASP